MNSTTSAAPAATTPTAPSTEGTTLPVISAVPADAKLSDVIKAVNALVAKANTKRDRGPDSEKTMTEDMARQVIFGDCADLKHKDAAVKLGLSYGQVYSARMGSTFKPVFKEWAAKNPGRDIAGPK